ncbi:MAG: hypothetical protein IPK19_10070 [Chloroflexi bacterium]|nr:hypothetical protein [Chloroflexota bacterium]
MSFQAEQIGGFDQTFFPQTSPPGDVRWIPAFDIGSVSRASDGWFRSDAREANRRANQDRITSSRQLIQTKRQQKPGPCR